MNFHYHTRQACIYQIEEETDMQKNDLITVVIEDIGANGEGIGKADGYTVDRKSVV